MITNEIVEKCANVFKQNIQKIIFSVMTMFILMQVFLIFMLNFAFSFAVSSVLFLALIAILVCLFGLYYGFSALMLLFARNQYGVIGHLFCGFKNFKRLLQTSMPFVAIILGSCLAASVVTLIAAPTADPAAVVATGEAPGILMATSYGAAILSIVLYLPYIFTPFTVFDYAEGTVKSCIKRGVFIFKNSCKIFIKAFFIICKKNLLFLFICVAVLVLGAKLKSISALAALAIPFTAILVYVIFVKTVVLAAVVYNQYLIEENPQSAENAPAEQISEIAQNSQTEQFSENLTDFQTEKANIENNEADEQGDVEL